MQLMGIASLHPSYALQIVASGVDKEDRAAA
jgi:hypothetical protein